MQLKELDRVIAYDRVMMIMVSNADGTPTIIFPIDKSSVVWGLLKELIVQEIGLNDEKEVLMICVKAT